MNKSYFSERFDAEEKQELQSEYEELNFGVPPTIVRFYSAPCCTGWAYVSCIIPYANMSLPCELSALAATSLITADYALSTMTGKMHALGVMPFERSKYLRDKLVESGDSVWNAYAKIRGKQTQKKDL